MSRRATKSYNLRMINPSLSREWHPTKNGKLTPLDFTPNSHTKVWWLCKNGHDWIAEIKTRNKGNGCPHCSGRFFRFYRRHQKISDNLVKEWHPTKNIPLTPEMLTSGSSKKVWWFCSKGHEWQATVASRTRGRRCAHCFGKFASLSNCLAVMNPVLAKEWHPTKNGNLTTRDVKAGSQRKVWWLCEKGHAWLAPVRERNKGVGYCPTCLSLAQANPKLAGEWHPAKNGAITPDNITANSGRKVWWMCKKGHEWQAVVAGRNYGSGCPFCKPKTSALELQIYSEMKYIFNNIGQRKKIDGIECDIFIPDLKVGIEVDGVYWHKHKLSDDKNKTLYFRNKGIFLIRLREKGLDKISENDITFSSKDKAFNLAKKILNVILENINLSDELRNRVETYLKNGVIMNEVLFFNLLEMLPGALPGFRLSDKNPKLTREWHPTNNGNLTPRDVSFGSQTNVWWLCEKGHEWKAPVSRRNTGAGCPYCDGKKVCLDNCLQSLNPLLAREWHPTNNGNLTPRDITVNSGKKAWWICKRGHEWQATINSRNKRKRGCPYCDGKLVCKDNCLENKNPLLAEEWHPTKNGKLTPKDVTRCSGKRVWWICKKGHEWEATVHDREGKGSGCPYCSGRKKLNK